LYGASAACSPINPFSQIIFCQCTACQQAVEARISFSGCPTFAPAFNFGFAMVSGCLNPSRQPEKQKMERRRLADILPTSKALLNH